jgi:hypothetical protein
MKACPSCESTRGYRYWPDSDGNDPVLTFEPPQPGQKEDGPGYVVIEHVMADVEWDFMTVIDCLECSESVRAGDVLEPEPVEKAEFDAQLIRAREHILHAQVLAVERISHIEEAINVLTVAKNMAAKGMRGPDESNS